MNQRLIRCLGRLKARGARLNPGIIDDRLFARSVMIIGIPGSPVLVRVEIGKRYYSLSVEAKVLKAGSCSCTC